jgi:hypothetical protein
MFVVIRTRYNDPQKRERLATFKKKAQAKSFIMKNKGGLNMGWVLTVEPITTSATIMKKRNFVKRLLNN